MGTASDFPTYWAFAYMRSALIVRFSEPNPGAHYHYFRALAGNLEGETGYTMTQHPVLIRHHVAGHAARAYNPLSKRWAEDLSV